jgi:hypothetical protein
VHLAHAIPVYANTTLSSWGLARARQCTSRQQWGKFHPPPFEVNLDIKQDKFVLGHARAARRRVRGRHKGSSPSKASSRRALFIGGISPSVSVLVDEGISIKPYLVGVWVLLITFAVPSKPVCTLLLHDLA